MQRFRLVFASILVACIAFLTAAAPAFAQTTTGNRYVIPRFTSMQGSELIIANLTSPDGDESTTVQGAGVGGRDAVRRASQPRTPVDLPLGPSRKGHRP